MDACDAVLSEFSGDKIIDLGGFSQAFSPQMRQMADSLRKKVCFEKLSMKELAASHAFNIFHDELIKTAAFCVSELLQKTHVEAKDIAAIGFHGKTLDHCPPSAALKKNIAPYTLQIGSGQMLADLTGIAVIYDFRSDDLMAGGEAAPLAPIHNANFAKTLGIGDAIFYNAGNTSNLSVVSNGQASDGWDAGPFNEFPDRLMRQYRHQMCDFNGLIGKQGKLIPDLLKKLFYQSALTASGDNFYELNPPKSGDPAYYFFDAIESYMDTQNFSDILYTAEYFSAYIAVHSMQYISAQTKMPQNLILFGGGWSNPVAFQVFTNLLNGQGLVLPEHQDIFAKICARFVPSPNIQISDQGKFMEARVFADLARYYLEKRCWSNNRLTGCKKACVLGIMRKPGESTIDDQICRAAKGWQADKIGKVIPAPF